MFILFPFFIILYPLYLFSLSFFWTAKRTKQEKLPTYKKKAVNVIFFIVAQLAKLRKETSWQLVLLLHFSLLTSHLSLLTFYIIHYTSYLCIKVHPEWFQFFGIVSKDEDETTFILSTNCTNRHRYLIMAWSNVLPI